MEREIIELGGPVLGIPPEDDDPLPRGAPGRKPSYPQDWSAYDAAKTNEDVFFKRLLQELLHIAVENPPKKKTGRPGFDRRTKLFCMCIKAYYKSDLRKAESILKELLHLNFIPAVPSYRSIDNFFNDTALSTILDDLIIITAMPLASVEENGAMDSTGFSISKYDSWFDHKWGNEVERKRCWRKLHAFVGCKTNVFIRVEVTEKNVADIAMLPTVVSDSPRYFAIKDFEADRAYSGRDVYNLLDKLGLNVYIPFRRRSGGEAKGSRLWKVMFEQFHENRDAYLRHYHQRSNVETCFHMLKQRFGHHLFTKRFAANSNEIKTRVLCHNLTVLIQEAAELGIAADFASCAKTLHAGKKPI